MNKIDILLELENNSQYVYIDSRWTYVGRLSLKSLPNLALKSYRCWRNQGDRCTKTNNKSYKYYGAVGVRRLWSSRECINFYINNLLVKENWITPTISRINDSGNYCCTNCQLKEFSENSAEVKTTETKRIYCHISGINSGKLVTITNLRTGKTEKHTSFREASRSIGRERGYLSCCIRNGHNITNINGDSIEVGKNE